MKAFKVSAKSSLSVKLFLVKNFNLALQGCLLMNNK